MLDFTSSTAEQEKQTRTTQVRHGEHLAAQIERAARALAVDKSTLVRTLLDRETARILEAQSRHAMTAEDAAQFAAALDTPPAPTPRAREAARRYRARVVHAD